MSTPHPMQYVLAYLIWAITFVLTLFTLLQWRNSLFVVLGMTPWNRYAENTINQFSFLALAIVGLCVIVFAEHYYRTGVESGMLFARFFRVSFMLMVILLMAHVALLVGQVVLALPVGLTLLIFVAEAVICILFYWFYRRALARV